VDVAQEKLALHRSHVWPIYVGVNGNDVSKRQDLTANTYNGTNMSTGAMGGKRKA
jgi:hypothetical protein